MRLATLPFWLALIALATPAFAQKASPAPDLRTLRVAVAASAREALDEVASDFERAGGPHVVLVSGASGKFAQQIAQGAPFDMFYSADTAYPARLDGLKLTSARKAYASGKLVVWALARAPFDVTQGGLRLVESPGVHHVAIANPQFAPYGRAAMQALKAGHLEAIARPKLVLGESVAQAAQFVQTGNAELGILPLSLAVSPALLKAGHYWLVPRDSYQPIVADAVIVRASRQQDLAAWFLEFSLSRAERPAWLRFGFDAPP